MTYRYRHGDSPLEGYTIKRGIGRGGFGEVYYAVSDAGREVALKTILHNEEIELRGVKHCLNLKSPHLVCIFDIRTAHDGISFVIMEYVTGPSLRELIREHPEGMGPQKAAFLIREIARGLSYLHERGIVHRDLKPENIFYEDGYVKIGDYGLSKFINASQQSGHTISVGTVHYMAPEIGTGSYHRGIDIYALGIILYELLTGEVPFKGDSFGEILMKHLTAPADLRRVEEPFRAAIDGALRKDPKERVPTVEDMVKGIFADDSIQLSISTFHPASLSQVAEKPQAEPGAVPPPAGEAPPLRQSPGSEGPPLEASNRVKDFLEDSAPETAKARSTPPPRSPSPDSSEWNLQKVLTDLSREAAKGWRTATRILRETIDGLNERACTPAKGPSEIPPGTFARFFWVFLGSGMIAVGLSCLIAPFVVGSRGEEVLALVSLGLGLLGYSGFALYRGLWVRRRSFWKRNLRPFLLVTSTSAGFIALAWLVLGIGFGFSGRHSNEEVLVALTVFAAAAFCFGFILLVDYVSSRWRLLQAQAGPNLPLHERPVSFLRRAGSLLLAVPCFIGAVGTLVAGVMELHRHGKWDSFTFFCFTVVTGAFGFFFLRQAFRRRRGHFWISTLRPFLLTCIGATLLICFLPLPLGLDVRRDELMAFIVTGSIAVGFSVPLLFLRGPRGLPQSTTEHAK